VNKLTVSVQFSSRSAGYKAGSLRSLCTPLKVGVQPKVTNGQTYTSLIE